MTANVIVFRTYVLQGGIDASEHFVLRYAQHKMLNDISTMCYFIILLNGS